MWPRAIRIATGARHVEGHFVRVGGRAQPPDIVRWQRVMDTEHRARRFDLCVAARIARVPVAAILVVSQRLHFLDLLLHAGPA